MTLDARFWAKVQITDDCWLWTGALNSRGYGCFAIRGRSQLAHRLSYEDAVGPIPDGLTIDHLCRTKHCVRPSHLEPVTAAENNQRAKDMVTHCPRGHELAGPNLVAKRNTRTGHLMRNCRECGNASRRAKRARERATSSVST